MSAEPKTSLVPDAGEQIAAYERRMDAREMPHDVLILYARKLEADVEFLKAQMHVMHGNLVRRLTPPIGNGGKAA